MTDSLTVTVELPKVPWDREAIEAVAAAIHDHGGGCCEVGYAGCDDHYEARKAAVVALTAWLAGDVLRPLYDAIKAEEERPSVRPKPWTKGDRPPWTKGDWPPDPDPCEEFQPDTLTLRCIRCGWWRSTHGPELPPREPEPEPERTKQVKARKVRLGDVVVCPAARLYVNGLQQLADGRVALLDGEAENEIVRHPDELVTIIKRKKEGK